MGKVPFNFLGSFKTYPNTPVPKSEEIQPITHLEAFSGHSATVIKERDNYTCRCGRSQHKGYYVDASHQNHDKKDPYYNNPDNGITECVVHHLAHHLQILQDIQSGESNLNEAWAKCSVGLIARRIWKEGIRTDRPVTFEDRQEVNRVFEHYGAEISDYINLSEYID
jgi:CDGSH-type Zn-finger protein